MSPYDTSATLPLCNAKKEEIKCKGGAKRQLYSKITAVDSCPTYKTQQLAKSSSRGMPSGSVTFRSWLSHIGQRVVINVAN